MFIKASVLKKLCRKDYEGAGITIENSNGCYSIMGRWHLEIKREFLNKKAMAALIEIVGPQPEEGECFTYQKKNEPQVHMNGIAYIGMQEYAEQNGLYKAKPTRIMVETSGCIERMMQIPDGTKFYINEEYLEAVGSAECDWENGEREPEWPVCIDDGRKIIWWNNVMGFMCNTRIAKFKKEKQLLDDMNGKDMSWQFSKEEEIGG